MTAYVHVNLRIKDPARQSALAPRFQAALQAAGGRILHFGPVAQTLEGDVTPLPLAHLRIRHARRRNGVLSVVRICADQG